MLDEDVAAGIKSEMERSGETFKQVVNRLMRLGHSSNEQEFMRLGVTKRYTCGSDMT